MALRIQLLLEDNEVELGQNVQIPLNKTFENLGSPTDIITEYSKTINIPLTSKNNEILANSYRLDRTILNNTSSSNLGLYLDPTKKIPMKLLYNSRIVLEGYAKFVSANNSTTNGYYTLNLFGVLGEIFQKLKSVVVSESQLTDAQKSEEDGGKKYILRDRVSASGKTLNAEYVYTSFINPNNTVYGIGYNEIDGTYMGLHPTDVIGFAPSYRGYYNDFDSSKMLFAEGDGISIEDKFLPLDYLITDKWESQYRSQNPSASIDDSKNYVEQLGVSNLVGDGFKDYQMNEYRSYMMKPYIYLNQLLQMYQDQIKELSDYEIELDTNWFNINNPYWTKLCYMLDFVDSRDNNVNTIEQFTYKTKLGNNFHSQDSNYGQMRISKTSIIENDYIKSSKQLSIQPFKIRLSLQSIGPQFAITGVGDMKMRFPKSTYFKIQFTFKIGTMFRYKYFFASFYDYNDVKNYISDAWFEESNFIKLSEPETKIEWLNWDEYIATGDGSVLEAGYYIDVEIPINNMGVTFLTNPTQIQMTNYVYVINETTNVLFTNELKIPYGGFMSTDGTPANSYKMFTGEIDPLYINRSWRDAIPISLASLYQKEDAPLFDVILQYTKMFGLLWDVDYENRKIKLLHRSTYFRDYTISDWSSKLDRSKDFVIEPIAFGTKLIKFNYEDVDGYRYSAYRDKYGANIGEKILVTGYDFGQETKELFKGISPSSASSKSYLSYNQIYNWNLTDTLTPTTTQHSFIDCESEDEKSSISIYNWYLRGSNKNASTSIYITDDSVDMKSAGIFCWHNPIIASDYGYRITSLPSFDLAINEPDQFPQLNGKVINCVFNTPTVDYTTGKLVSKSLGNSIYDIVWKDYINERYNIQNKKVTGYFHLPVEEFLSFKFHQFVHIDNQIFMVNKIIDYDLNAGGLTKVELVQITNPNTYISGSELFPPIVVSPNEVDIIGSLQSEDAGSIGLSMHITSFDSNGSLARGEWGLLEGNITFGDGTTSTAFDEYVWIEYGDWVEGVDTMVLYWVDMQGLKFEGSLTYTEPNGEEYTIPITIDYTR